MLECQGCQRRQELMEQFARMADAERHRREELETHVQRLKALVRTRLCQLRTADETESDYLAVLSILC